MKKTKAKALPGGYVWCIAYIVQDNVKNLAKELSKDNQYNGVEFYIPTIKILKKQFKGDKIFDEVPFLFNYGFFKIPYSFAIIPDMLLKLKQDISCIHSWVKDPARVIGKKETSRTFHDGSGIPLAVASELEIARVIKSSQINDIYSSQDVDNLKPGQMITLVGYPFEGMEAEVVKVDKKSKKVRVSLNIEYGIKELDVLFDNVFYTIYRGGYDENYSSEKTVDDFDIKLNTQRED